MKPRHYFAAAAVLGLAACSSDEPALPASATVTPMPHSTPAPKYLALPGQAAVEVTSDVDAAFDRQAAVYAGAAAAVTTPPAASEMQTSAAAVRIPTPADSAPVDAPVSFPAIGSTSIAPPAVNTVSVHESSPAPDMTAPEPDVTAPAATAGSMKYKVRITNGTEGRLFIEAQDAAGTIYPCGFMEGGRTYTTPLENAAPVKGPITIVVRDPDQPEAPEIRRYKVNPPAEDYNGKAIGITILSGGRYTAALDGQTYYASPAPMPQPVPAGGNAPVPASQPAGA